MGGYLGERINKQNVKRRPGDKYSVKKMAQEVSYSAPYFQGFIEISREIPTYR